MKGILKLMLLIGIVVSGLAQTGVGDNFNNNSLSCNWYPYSNYTLTESNSELQVQASIPASSYQVFELKFSTINISSNPVLTVRVKSGTGFTLRIDLQDALGRSTNAIPVSSVIPSSGSYSTYTFDYTGKFSQGFPSAATVDPSQITSIILFANAGGSSFYNTFYLDDIYLGIGGVSDGGGSTCPPPPPANVTSDIRLNQVGFYPDCQKVAIVKGNPSGTAFYVRSLDLSVTHFTGTLTNASTWSFSGESVRVADFSSFVTPGSYRLEVPGVGSSFVFKIGNNVLNGVNKALIKAYYHNRGSTATTAAYAGVWARAGGHWDTNCEIHWSAASAGRPTGTIVSSPKGWYDAGDYNSYVVNSGISTYSLLSAYENFPTYFDTLNLNIPESGGTYPDILDEVKWNLDWLLTMQDPGDGGVYTKKTSANFDPFVMPNATSGTRYLVAKSSAAAFDFAAVMAVAYRVYKPFNLTYANTCLTAARAAYNWGIANPNIAFTNPSGINTGEYGDYNLDDEKEWAATELYISTKENPFFSNSFKNANGYGIPDWGGVRTLGLMSLILHRKNLTSAAFPDTMNMMNKMYYLAGLHRNHYVSSSAYKVPMGTAGNNDFVWGSNGVAANQGMVLMSAYRMSGDITYYQAAIAAIDYLLGRNATTYCFVTGFGSVRVMNPHHRPSYADGVTDPVPGWLAGGPVNSVSSDGCYNDPSPAKAYVDGLSCFTKNEITINWNAPFVFLSAAAEAIGPCNANVSLPVEWLMAKGTYTAKGNKLEWKVADEKNTAGYLVQRSDNGRQFYLLSTLSQLEGDVHEFLDATGSNARYFYRIVHQNKEGVNTFSNVFMMEPSTLQLSFYPNPAQNELIFSGATGSYQIKILDLTAKLVLEKTIAIGEEQLVATELNAIKPGVYLLEIQSENATQIHKLVIH